MTHKIIVLIFFFAIPILAFAQSDANEDSLKRAALFLEPVEIKAVRAAENAPFAKTTITKKDIKKANLGQDLTYILNQTPSVIINSDAGNGVGYTGFRIRGSDATRVNMTINGIPYNDAESQGLFFVNLPDFVSSVNDVQIQRGIGSSSNGAGAFGASMNFSTNEVQTDAYAEINNSIGSFNTWKHTVRAGSGLINDHFTIDARLSKISSDGFIDRAESDLSSFYASAAYLAGKSSIRFNVMSGKERTYQAWNGIPEAELHTSRRANYSGTAKPGKPYDNETDNYQQDHYQLFFNHRFNSKLQFNTAAFLTRGKGYYENYLAKEPFADYGRSNFPAGTDSITETDLVRQLWLDNHYFGQIISLQYTGTRTRFTTGGGWNTYKGKHYGDVIWAEVGFPVDYRWYDLRARKTDVNAYAKYQYAVTDNLELFGDVQYRRVDYDLGGFRKNPELLVHNIYNFLNPKAGLTLRIGGTRLYASYAFAAKEPNRDDFEAGATQQPKPEKMHNVEAGAERKYDRWWWNANFYLMKYRDQLVPTGKINDVGSYTRINIPDSYRTGIELMAGGNIATWASVSANVTLSRNRLKDFTEYYDDYDEGGQKSNFYASSDIAFSPAVTGGATVTLKPAKAIDIDLIGKYISRQYLDNTSRKERSLAAYYVQDARLSWVIPNQLFKRLTAILQVNNVFDKKYEANGYTFSYIAGGQLMTENFYFPQAGTNMLFALNIEL